MFNLIPKEVRFFDLFDQQSQNIIKAAQLLREQFHNFAAARAMTDVIVEIVHAMDRTIKCLRTMDPGFHEHAVEVNRLENAADRLLRESLAELFEAQADPIEVIKWKEIYETLETVTDRCEDVANVIEGIILKMA